jgi:hypothetical protein
MAIDATALSGKVTFLYFSRKLMARAPLDLGKLYASLCSVSLSYLDAALAYFLTS